MAFDHIVDLARAMGANLSRDQSVLSNTPGGTYSAEKSSRVPSAVTPITSSVAGLMLSNTAPDDDGASSPSISIRHSAMGGFW